MVYSYHICSVVVGDGDLKNNNTSLNVADFFSGKGSSIVISVCVNDPRIAQMVHEIFHQLVSNRRLNRRTVTCDATNTCSSRSFVAHIGTLILIPGLVYRKQLSGVAVASNYTSRTCEVKLLVFALDKCFWHASPQMFYMFHIDKTGSRLGRYSPVCTGAGGGKWLTDPDATRWQYKSLGYWHDNIRGSKPHTIHVRIVSIMPLNGK